MAYPIKNTALTQTKPSVVVSYGSIGVNQGGYGLTSSTGFWNGKTPNIGGYITYLGNGNSSPTMYISTGDTQLIALANQLIGPGTAVNIVDALQSLQGSTTLCINMDCPNIVTSGLTLYLDAGFVPSYPKGDIIWDDISGSISGHYGGLNNGPLYDSANYGSIVFDGTNDYVGCGTILNYTSGDFSFSYWIYVTSLTTNQVGQGPVIIYKGAYQVNGYYDQIQPNGLLFFSTNTLGSNVTTSTATGTISSGNTYNICYTRSGSSIRIYVNGVDVTVTAGTHVNPVTSSSNFIIASYGGSINSNVKMYSFANYNKTLSSAEVLQNYYAGLQRFIPTSTTTLWLDGENTNTRVITPTTAYDTGINLTNGTLMNSMSLVYRDGGQSSFSFDGINNYIDCGSLPNLAASSVWLTVSIWFKITATPSGAYTMIKFGANVSGWLIGVSSSGIYFSLYTTGGPFNGGGYSVSLNVWHNVTITYDGATFILYLDGSSPYSNTITSGGIINGGSTTVNIGRDGSTNTNYFAGKMSIVRTFAQTLTSTDILTIYKAGKPRHGL
jgi:hypothetical protein